MPQIMIDQRIEIDPPLANHFSTLFKSCNDNGRLHPKVRECELPLIDLGPLLSDDKAGKELCESQIVNAATEWGFFQIVNHGISPELMQEMNRKQVQLFQLPFEKKASCRQLSDSYRWGTPTATSMGQFSWSEAFHVPLSMILGQDCCYGEYQYLRDVMERFAASMSNLARLLAGILAKNMNQENQFFDKYCKESACFLRLNRYPPCPLSAPEIYGLVPHTDSDFLTIVNQDHVGGLQLMKDSRWIAVKPNPSAFIVNIGDLFQAWSNGVYKSVEHMVMANKKMERYSVAYFLCPSYDTIIQSCIQPSAYKNFTFREYRNQVQEDVKKYGHKVGLPRFLHT